MWRRACLLAVLLVRRTQFFFMFLCQYCGYRKTKIFQFCFFLILQMWICITCSNLSITTKNISSPFKSILFVPKPGRLRIGRRWHRRQCGLLRRHWEGRRREEALQVPLRVQQEGVQRVHGRGRVGRGAEVVLDKVRRFPTLFCLFSAFCWKKNLAHGKSLYIL